MNKADYISLINTKLPDGGNIPSTDHRDTMHTDPNSILELVYGDAVVENTSGVLAITTQATFDYDLNFQKVGRFGSITGEFTSSGSIGAGALIATITDADWIAQSKGFYSGVFTEFGEALRFYINGNEIRTTFSVFGVQTFFIETLIYNLEN